MEQQIEDILESSTTLSHSGREWPLGTGRDEGRDSGGSGERTALQALAWFLGFLVSQCSCLPR